MSMDGKTLAQAFERKTFLVSSKDAAFRRRRAEVFKKLPELEKNERRIRETAADAALSAIRKGKSSSAQLRDENLELQAKEADILAANGFPADYLRDEPLCPLCGDTGYSGARVCSCVKALYADIQTAALDRVLDFSEHCFEKFDLSLYSPMTDARRGISSRDNMENILEFCREYAEGFSRKSPNLAFFGGTGLGKTFLSACIAKEVSEKGLYVVYTGAADMFSAYEAEKFSRYQPEAPVTDRFTDCDLLVLDDLGTEMVTQFTVSCLYSVINTRLMRGKKTIISSNLTVDELRRSYTPQIMSRLEGEYRNLSFFGEDIRIKRRNRF